MGPQEGFREGVRQLRVKAILSQSNVERLAKSGKVVCDGHTNNFNQHADHTANTFANALGLGTARIVLDSRP